MNNYLKVKDNKNLVRDPHTKAIININEDGLKEYQDKRKMYEKIMKVDELETEIKEIKSLLNIIIQKL